MHVLTSNINVRSDEFRTNKKNGLDALQQVRELERKVVALSEKQRERFESLNKLLPRERVDQLLDPGSPFLALSPLAGLGMHEDDGKEEVLGGGVIAGIGQVCGTRVALIVNDSAIKGGSNSWAGGVKALRMQEIALKQKLPVINLVESAGGNLRLTHMTFAVNGFPRLQSCMAALPRAVPMSPECQITSSLCVTRRRCSLRGRRC